MSTSALINVWTSRSLNHWIYRHYDGFPHIILKDIYRAYRQIQKSLPMHQYQIDREDYIASHIMSQDPFSYHPMPDGRIDINFKYKILTGQEWLIAIMNGAGKTLVYNIELTEIVNTKGNLRKDYLFLI